MAAAAPPSYGDANDALLSGSTVEAGDMPIMDAAPGAAAENGLAAQASTLGPAPEAAVVARDAEVDPVENLRIDTEIDAAADGGGGATSQTAEAVPALGEGDVGESSSRVVGDEGKAAEVNDEEATAKKVVPRTSSSSMIDVSRFKMSMGMFGGAKTSMGSARGSGAGSGFSSASGSGVGTGAGAGKASTPAVPPPLSTSGAGKFSSYARRAGNFLGEFFVDANELFWGLMPLLLRLLVL